MSQMDAISGPGLQVAIHNQAKGFPPVIWQAGAVFAFALLLYGRSLQMTFVGESAEQFRWMESQSYASLFMAKAWIYRPLVFVLWKLILALTGRYDPFIYMLPNFLIHALNAALVCLLARHLTNTNAVALLAGLLFASHPYHVQIAWVEVLFHPLMTFLVLLSFWLYTVANSHSKRSGLFLLGSYLALGLAFFAHESGVVGALLLLSYDLLFHGLSMKTFISWSKRFVFYAVLTSVYLIWYGLLPATVPPPPPLPPASLFFQEIAKNLFFFLQGLVFPVAPLASLLRDWLGLSSYSALAPMALLSLMVLFYLYIWHRMVRIFVFALLWFTISIAPPSVLLSSGYVESGSRLFYLGSVSASLLWAGAAVVLGRLLAQRCSNRSAALSPLLASAAVVLLILVPASVFTLDRLSLFQRGSGFVRQLAQSAAKLSSQNRIVFLNIPNYLNRKAMYPLGNFGMVLIHNYVSLNDSVYINSGERRDTRAYVSKELMAEAVALHPSEETLVWSYFTYGEPVQAEDLVQRILQVDQVFVCDPADWRVKSLSDFTTRWPPVFLVQNVEKSRSEGARVYLPQRRTQDLSPSSPGVKTFNEEAALVLPAGAPQDSIFVLLESDKTLSSSLLRLYPNGRIKQEAALGGPLLSTFQVTAHTFPSITPNRILPNNLDNQVQLLGFDLEKQRIYPGESLQLTLYWQALRKIDQSYTVFTHVTGRLNPTTGSPIWGQWDSLPGSGSYPTTVWDKDEIVVDRRTIPVRADTPPGLYEVEVGMYLLKTGERLLVLDGNSRAGSNQIRLTSVEVAAR